MTGARRIPLNCVLNWAQLTHLGKLYCHGLLRTLNIRTELRRRIIQEELHLPWLLDVPLELPTRSKVCSTLSSASLALKPHFADPITSRPRPRTRSCSRTGIQSTAATATASTTTANATATRPILFRQMIPSMRFRSFTDPPPHGIYLVTCAVLLYAVSGCPAKPALDILIYVLTPPSLPSLPLNTREHPRRTVLHV